MWYNKFVIRDKKARNILVIGNGFDLAHELNTSYVDFLQVIEILDNTKIIDLTLEPHKFLSEFQNKKNEKVVRDYVFRKLGNKSLDVVQNFIDLKYRNFWVMYFCALLDKFGRRKTTWIDFEAQIKDVIIDVENAIANGDLLINNDGLITGINNIRVRECLFKRDKNLRSSKDIIQVLESDLNDLIYCFELYTEKFVNDIIKIGDINFISPDIESLHIDKVLSFNYTRTFEYIYGKGKNIEYHYVHGKADINHTVETSNLIMGINEYLPDDRKDKDLNFIEFKKFYQRICKGTGSLYKRWLKEANKSQPCHVYIFGHSLDVTDSDILRDLILNKYTFTTIYYQNQNTKKKQVSNLIRVIGQDELIKRTSEALPTIKFKQQQPMRKLIR